MKVILFLLVGAFIVQAKDMGVLRKEAENKFAPMAGLPQCLTLAVQSGNPSNGPSVILFKASSGCQIPWHWHTPVEEVMIVSGSARVEMKDSGKSETLGPGGFALMPSKHVHEFTCTSACSAFLSSDTAFDIHYVDAKGTELPAQTALMKKSK